MRTLNLIVAPACLALVVSFAACCIGAPISEGGGEDASPDAGASSPDAGTAREVTVTRFDTYVQEQQDEVVAADLSEVHAWALEDGGFRPLSIEPLDAGVGVVHGAPPANLYFNVATVSNPVWVVSGAEAIDLGTSHVGRPPEAFAETGTELGLTITGNEGNALKFDAPSAGITGMTPTSTDAPFVFDLVGKPMVQAGDQVWFTESKMKYVDGPAGAQAQSLISSSFETDAISLAQGQRASVDVALSPVTSSAEYPLDIRMDQFVDEARKAVSTPLGLGAFVVTAAAPFGKPSNNLLGLAITGPSQRVDLLEVRNPYPASWTEQASVTVFTNAGFFVQTGDIALLSHPVVPSLGLPLDIEVDDHPTSSNVEAVANPVVRWSPPMTGTADFYSVSIRQGQFAIAEFFTSDHELRIPPGVLHAGQSYDFRVWAHKKAVDLASHPFKPVFESVRTGGWAFTVDIH